MIVALLGPSGVGKTALARILGNLGDNTRRVVTYTTRPKRPEEVSGTDYIFVCEREFADLDRRMVFVETTTYDGHLYGISRESVEDAADKILFVVVTSSGVRALQRCGFDVFPVLVRVHEADRMERMAKVGRNRDDAEETDALDIADMIVFNSDGALHGTADRIMNAVLDTGRAPR